MRRVAICLVILAGCARTPQGRRAVYIGAGTVLAGSIAMIATGLVRHHDDDCSGTCFDRASSLWTGGIVLAMLSSLSLGTQASTRPSERLTFDPAALLLPLVLPRPKQQPPLKPIEQQ